ncbi:MAG: FAD-dependent oxidoreductase [Bacilli bacterium]|jgi:2-enoate reductase
MKEIYKPLFTPWKIGDVEIKNRIVMTSMGGTSIFGWMETPHFDQEAAHFLLERAKNNVGLILPGIAPLKNPMGGQWLHKSKGAFKKLKPFMDEIHQTGAKMFVQLTAGFGRSMAVSPIMELIGTNKILKVLAKPMIDVDYLCAAPSPNPNRWSDKITSREITREEMNKIVESFAKTAKLCKDAGVDGVEVHAVHEGYLLDQFTLKYVNHRTDEYGGSFENRYRFPVEIVKAIKKECGSDYPVSLRYSIVSKTKGFRSGALPGEQYVEVGRDMEESEKAAKYLQDAGYDMLNCDNGTYDAWYWAHPPGYMPHNCNLEYAEHIKKFVDIPVVAAGRMEPDAAAKSIGEGHIDGMGVARQFLADAEWVTKLMEGKEDKIRPCITCHNGCFNIGHYKGVANDQDLHDTLHMARCAINAETMQSNKYYVRPAAKKKDIAIIGGGIGGMEVARVATMRGHNVVLYEKSDALGGVFKYASNPPFKEKERALLHWYRKEMKDMGIDVRLNTEIKNLDMIKADKIVVATGSKAKMPPIPGIDKCIEVKDYLTGDKKVGETVIVVGGGLTGCEIAYDLHLKGKNPIIVEMKNDLIATKGVCLANSSFLREYFALHKVPVYLETKVSEVKDDGLVGIDKDGEIVNIKADSVIMSIGFTPTPVAKESSKVQLVGDCLSVGNLRSVIWRAWDVGMRL